VREELFPYFIASWALLGVAGFFLFYVSNNAAFKRRYFPWFASLTGLLFVGIAAAMGIPVAMLAVLLPFVALITFLNIRGTQFCGVCGKTLLQQMPFSRAKFCSRCGAPLRDEGRSPRVP
jgi:hypothetical protein